MVTLCTPFNHVTLSSTSNDVALRDCGDGAAPGDVSAVLTDGNVRWNPFVFATLPVYMPRFSSPKKMTGAEL